MDRETLTRNAEAGEYALQRRKAAAFDLLQHHAQHLKLYPAQPGTDGGERSVSFGEQTYKGWNLLEAMEAMGKAAGKERQTR